RDDGRDDVLVGGVGKNGSGEQRAQGIGPAEPLRAEGVDRSERLVAEPFGRALDGEALLSSVPRSAPPRAMADKESGAKKPALARTVKDKWRSKHWYKVRAPGLFQHVELGETVATEPEQVVGRTLEATLPELSGSGDSGKAHVKLRFRIERVSGEGVAEARFIGHDLTS